MKKCFGILLCILFFNVSFAQETNVSGVNTNNILKPGETKTIVQNLYSDNMPDLQNIQSRFCNDGNITKDLKLEMRPGQRKEICVLLANKSNKSINILFGFSEGSVDKDGVPSCQGDTIDKNNFSKFIINDTITGMTIPAKSNSIQRFQYLAPKNTSGSSFGCFGYRINQAESIKDGNMFLIIPRRVGYISVDITGSVYNFGRRDDTKDIYNNNTSTILKIIIAIFGVRLLVSILEPSKKKEEHHKHNKK